MKCDTVAASEMLLVGHRLNGTGNEISNRLTRRIPTHIQPLYLLAIIDWPRLGSVAMAILLSRRRSVRSIVCHVHAGSLIECSKVNTVSFSMGLSTAAHSHMLFSPEHRTCKRPFHLSK